eukprot:scaffold40910_cov72-Phaeocystis_antarctica.AAC.4
MFPTDPERHGTSLCRNSVGYQRAAAPCELIKRVVDRIRLNAQPPKAQCLERAGVAQCDWII